MSEQPLVSIIIPTYNRAKVIATSIASVIAQSYTNWELIIVSDKCTDNTRDVVEAYMNDDDRIKFVVNDRSKGTSGARNCGMLHATGDYISFLDSDDHWHSFHLKDSIDTLQRANGDVCFALWEERHGETIYKTFDDVLEQQILDDMRSKFKVIDNAIVFETGLLERFLAESKLFYCIITMVFKRDLLQSFDLFNDQFEIGEDIEFMIQFFDRCRVCLITKSHCIYNQSPDSVYLFCDRRLLDPDTLYQNKETLQKIESIAIRSLAFKKQLRTKIEGLSGNNRKQLLLLSDYALARQYYTLSYINRLEKKKALRYCWQSMKHNVNPFNVLLVFHIVLSIKGNSFLRRPVDLW